MQFNKIANSILHSKSKEQKTAVEDSPSDKNTKQTAQNQCEETKKCCQPCGGLLVNVNPAMKIKALQVKKYSWNGIINFSLNLLECSILQRILPFRNKCKAVGRKTENIANFNTNDSHRKPGVIGLSPLLYFKISNAFCKPDVTISQILVKLRLFEPPYIPEYNNQFFFNSNRQCLC